MSSVCAISLALTFSFCLLLFLPSLFLFLFLFLTNKKFMANLYNSAKEGVDTNDVLSFATAQNRRPSMNPVSSRWLESVSEKRRIQGLPRTTETGRQQNNPALLTDGSTKLVTQSLAARTSVTRSFQNLHIPGPPAAPAAPPSTVTVNNEEF